MSFVSLAEVCRRLGIDAKTLRRWLGDAQLPLQHHPSDGRKKGVSSEQLHVLARLHQRSLALVEEEPPAPLGAAMPELPAALLALPKRLGVLQAQITALQQQVAALTRLLTQREPGPALPLAPTLPSKTLKRPRKLIPGKPGANGQAPTLPSKTLKRPPKPTSPAPRSPPAAKTPRKLVHVIPRVEYSEQGRYVVICPKQGLLPLEPDTQEWFAWLAEQDAFRFVGKGGHFTAHHWWRVPRGAWRAHRHIRNHSYTLRLAPTHGLTMAVLEQAAAALQAHLQ